MSGNWTEHKDAEGRTYYYNAETNTSRWDKPPASQTPAQKALEESPWKEYEDEESKRKYYFNTDTQETTWEIPEEFQLLQDRVSAEIKASLMKAAPKEYASIGMDFRTKEEAQDAFNQVLDDIGVESHWTWEMCVRRGNSHKLYKALKSVNDRKEAFMLYIKDLKNNDLKRNRKQVELDEALLRKLFKESGQISSKSRYKNVLDLFKDNEEFQSTNLLNRRVFFKKYVKELQEAAAEMEKEIKKNNMNALKALLPKLPISTSTSWAQLTDMLRPYKKDDSGLNCMDQMDILTVFEDYIHKMDGELKKDREMKERQQKRHERKCREAFRSLLQDLKNKGILHINSKWKHIYPEIKEETVYLEMLGNSGSTPLELFWDEIMIMEDLYRPARRMIFDIVQQSRFDFTENTTLKQFADYFERDFRKLDPDHVKIAYGEFLHKAESRAYEEKKYAERKIRKKMDAFRHYLKHLSPSINIDDKWQNVRHRCFGPEYDSLDEEKRIEAFEKFIRRSKEKGSNGSESHKRQKRGPSANRKDHDYKKRKSHHTSSEEEGELMD